MDAKDEMIEEIEDIEEIDDTSKKEEVSGEKENDTPNLDEPVIEEPIIGNDITIENETKLEDEEVKEEKVEEKSTEKEDNNQVVEPKKNKAPLIVLLSILLVLDIAALVIYIIGIEKVISFIK